MSSPDVVIRIDRKGLVLVAALILVGSAAGLLWSETLTLSTTYPSPAGIYNQLVTTGDSGAVAADTTLNRNAGNTILVPPTNAGGKVGVGTAAPSEALEVAGNAKVSGTVSAGLIKLNNVVAESSACGSEGLLGRDSAATLLTCQAGQWKKAQSGAAWIWKAGDPAPPRQKIISCFTGRSTNPALASWWSGYGWGISVGPTASDRVYPYQVNGVSGIGDPRCVNMLVAP